VNAEEINVTFDLFSNKVCFYPSGYLHSQTNRYRSAENPITCLTSLAILSQGSPEPFFSDTKNLHLYITHADTTFNICQITGNMHLIQEDCAPPHTTNHFKHHLYYICRVKNLILTAKH